MASLRASGGDGGDSSSMSHAGRGAGAASDAKGRDDGSLASSLPPLPANPLLYQVHARSLVWELRRDSGDAAATLESLPDSYFDRIARDGYDILYLLGVWTTGPLGYGMSLTHLTKLGQIPEAHAASAPGEDADFVCGSPFAVTEYEAHEDLGGNAALALFRARLAQRGVRMWLDMVPNHVGVGHPWAETRQDLFVHGTDAQAAARPQNYTRVGDTWIAHGRDPFFDGWRDTLQLNYRNPALRDEMVAILRRMTVMCDGVRCDMAMLLESGVFESTWGSAADASLPEGVAPAEGQFWPTAIAATKAAASGAGGFTFMAEVYWDMEFALHGLGFDYTYDKRLYDRLEERNVEAVRGHLRADLEFQHRSVRFLENHDEPRAAATFGPTPDRLRAALVVAFTVPGLRFVHWGQEEGRRDQMSMHVRRRKEEACDPAVCVVHRKLLDVLRRPELRHGRWVLADTRASMDGNPSHGNLLAHCWLPAGEADASRGASSGAGSGAAGVGGTVTRTTAVAAAAATLVVVNYSDGDSDGHVVIPDDVIGVFRDKTLQPRLPSHVLLRDLLGAVWYKRAVDDLASSGLWVKVGPWTTHCFEVTGLCDV